MEIPRSKLALPPAEGLKGALIEKTKARRELQRSLTNFSRRQGQPRNDLTPPLALETRAIGRLRAGSHRVRKDDARQVARIKDSINEFGVCRPVLITTDGEIIDGHAVVAACQELEMTGVACLVVDHLSPADIRRLRIVLNRISEKGTWDFEALKIEVAELALEFGEDFHIPGIEPEELDILLLDDESGVAETPVTSEPPVRPVTQVGDVWMLGNHVLGCGDARNRQFMATVLGGRLARLVLTDPPYNVPVAGHVTGGAHREFVMASGEMTTVEFETFLQDCLVLMKVFLIDGGLAFVFMDWRGINALLTAAQAAGLDLINLAIWAKTNGGMGSLYRSQHEMVPVFKNGTAPHINNISLGSHGRYRTNLWTYPGASSLGSDARNGLAVHPTSKPVALLADAMRCAASPSMPMPKMRPERSMICCISAFS